VLIGQVTQGTTANSFSMARKLFKHRNTSSSAKAFLESLEFEGAGGTIPRLKWRFHAIRVGRLTAIERRSVKSSTLGPNL